MTSMVRSSWGLDSPREELPYVPCQDNPPAWDIPNTVSKRRQYEIARAAIEGCLACSIREACEVAAKENPPEHDGVMAGKVYFRGREFTLHKFGRLRRNPPAGNLRYGGLKPEEYKVKIAELVEAGYKDNEIAKMLNVSTPAIKQQRYKLLRSNKISQKFSS